MSKGMIIKRISKLGIIGLLVMTLVLSFTACDKPAPTTPTTPTPTTPAPTTPAPTTPTPTPPATSEDFKFTGKIESMGADTWVIGGKSFKVTSTTMLDTGLAVGVTATVEYKAVGGQDTAISIETDAQAAEPGEDLKFTGKIESMGADAWAIGGKTFKVTSNTTLDTGLAVGVTATVEYITVGGQNTAISIETDAQAADPGDDFKFTGPIQSLSAGTWVIGGKTFKTDNSTVLDNGLTVGVVATVEFIVSNGQNVARSIETAAAGVKADDNFHFSGIITSLSANTFVIGGKTFKTDASTVLDTGLIVGVSASVEFTVEADGSLKATKIETP